MTEQTNCQTESKIRKILLNEITILLSIVAGVFSYVTFVILPVHDLKASLVTHVSVQEQYEASIDKQLGTIKNGDLVDIQRNLDVNTAAINELRVELSNQMTKLNTIMEERFPAKK